MPPALPGENVTGGAGTFPNTTSDLLSNGLKVANPATADLVVALPDISVTKSDGVTAAVPGQDTLTYTIAVSNIGTVLAPSVAVGDTFPAGLACSWTSVAAGGATGNTSAAGAAIADTLAMPAGSSVTYTATCSISSDATGTLSNTVTATSNIAETTTANNTATDNDTVMTPSSDLSVTKTDGVTSAVPGQDTLTYTIVVSNAGPSADAAASFIDTFPASLTCNWTSVAAGGATGNTAAGSGNLAETLGMPVGSSVTYTASCSIDSAATGTVSNTATVTASGTDPVPGNNSATDADTVLTPVADVVVTKTDNVTTAVPGGTLTYIIGVSNAGPSAATAVNVADTFPVALTCAWTSVVAGGATGNSAAAGAALGDILAMPAGSSVTYTVTCSIPADATGTLTNTVTAALEETDPNPGNNTATDNDTTLTPQADVSVTKTDGQTQATPDTTLIYTIVVANAGPSNASSVAVADMFPAGLTCSWTSVVAGGATGSSSASGAAIADTLVMPAGSSATYTVTCHIAAAALGVLTNTVKVTPTENDPDASNNTATDLTGLGVPLLLTKDFVDDPVVAGGPVSVRFTITNLSATATAVGISFTDDLDGFLAGTGALGVPMTDICGNGSSLSGASLLTFAAGTLPPGAMCDFVVMVQVPAGAASGVFANTTSRITATMGGFPVSGDPATARLLVGTFTFTDDPLQVGVTQVLAAHFDELRGMIDYLRELRGLPPYPWTDPTLTARTTIIKAEHLTDMRRALDDIFVLEGTGPRAWVIDPATVRSTGIAAADITEIRTLVKAREPAP